MSRLTVDLGAIEHNMQVLRRIVGPGCLLCPVVKADAYNLGVRGVAPTLAAAGADMFAVYTPLQAAQVLSATSRRPVLILMPLSGAHELVELCASIRSGLIHATIHDAEQTRCLARIARELAVRLPVHIEVDTGMSRGGCNPAEAERALAVVAAEKHLTLAGVMTHFARAENDASFTQLQIQRLDDLLMRRKQSISPDCIIHAANTFATMRSNSLHRSMVRVGQAWVGYGSEWMQEGDLRDAGTALQPCLTWSSSIIHLKTIEAGTSVGYGSTWTAPRRSRIGLVPVGYADGYPIALGEKDHGSRAASVRLLVDGLQEAYYAPVIGMVNMDQIVLDLTDVDPPDRGVSLVRVGTEVELISPDRTKPNHLPTLARTAGTIPYNLLCRLSERIPRVYLEPSRPVVEVVGAVEPAVTGVR